MTKWSEIAGEPFENDCNFVYMYVCVYSEVDKKIISYRTKIKTIVCS